MKAISLFDTSGVMLKPWAEAGYDCHNFDMQNINEQRDGMGFHEWDAFSGFLPLQEVAFVAAFPPCTHLAVSGARWFKGKGLKALAESIHLFGISAEYCEARGAPYMIENPVSTISTYWRQPDYKFHPCHYSGYIGGDEFYTKETWLWTGGGFVMPPRDMGPGLFKKPDTTYIHNQPPGPERANIRSRTPEGFARAVFEANHHGAAHANIG